MSCANGLDAREGLWSLPERAPDHGLADAVEAALSAHERAGAQRSERLPAADDVVAAEVLAGVCSMNCEAACRVALEVHGLDEHVAAVIGRDTIAERKPHLHRCPRRWTHSASSRPRRCSSVTRSPPRGPACA